LAPGQELSPLNLRGDEAESRNGNHQPEDGLSYICSEPGCGQQVLLVEFNEHEEMHDAEKMVLDLDDEPSSQSDKMNIDHSSYTHEGHSSLNQNFSTSIPPALRQHEHKQPRPKKLQRDPNRPAQHMGRRFLSALGIERSRPQKKSTHSNRLGVSFYILMIFELYVLCGVWKTCSEWHLLTFPQTAELGPHAYEDQMPHWLYKQLEQGPKVRTRRVKTRSGRIITEETVDGETEGVLPILRRLIESDPYVDHAYLCHPMVIQIGKEKNEGGFCGFRNIQMQISYLQCTRAPGGQYFPGRTPGILQLQDQIEKAWDNGIHWYSREQIGKLKGTRKWIGTLEVSERAV
jgi:hypothetical protein